MAGTDASLNSSVPSATLTAPPESLQRDGVTYWSARRLADWLARSRKLRVSYDSVVRVWRRYGLAPHRTEGVKFSTDPKLETKIRDVVGLYMNPRENAMVLSLDEKSQCQALERTQPILPLGPGPLGAIESRTGGLRVSVLNTLPERLGRAAQSGRLG